MTIRKMSMLMQLGRVDKPSTRFYPGYSAPSDPLSDPNIDGFYAWDAVPFGSAVERSPGGGSWDMDHNPNNWTVLQAKAVARILPITDADSPRGWKVAQVTVAPGDVVSGSSGERAEVTSAYNKAGALFQVDGSSGHEFYALAIKVPVGWTAPSGWGIPLQLHGPTSGSYGLSGASPTLALEVTDRFRLDYSAGNYDLYSGLNSVPIAFSVDSLATGHWVQFVFDVQWSYTSSGSLKVYRRDDGQTAFTIVADSASIISTINASYSGYLGTWTGPGVPTLQYSASAGLQGPHDWKTGLYRNSNPGFTSQLFLGPLVRGKTFNAVADAAFGSH